MLCKRWRLVGPPASAFRGRALNHPVLRWLKTVVVEASKGLVGIETGGPWIAFGMSLAGARAIGQVVSGVEAA